MSFFCFTIPETATGFYISSWYIGKSPRSNSQQDVHNRTSHLCAVGLTRTLFSKMGLTVNVYLCDLKKQYFTFVEEIPIDILGQCAPAMLSLLDINKCERTVTLPLRVRSLDISREIELPGLRHLFYMWRSRNSLGRINKSLVPSVSDGVFLYCALQLVQDNEGAELMRSIFMSRLRTQPVTEIDVQNIWRAFQSHAEWDHWLDAIFWNIAHYDLPNKPRTGGYIGHFLETELLQMTHEQRLQVLAAFERNRVSSLTRFRQFLYRAWHRMVARTT
jgi:hypothetical protein